MKILNIFNTAPLYREGIYRLIDKEFRCDWLFGEPLSDIKQLDLSKLNGKTTISKTIRLLGGRAYWQKGVVKQLLKRDYTHYILLGEERSISTWVFLILSKFFPKKKIIFWSHGSYGKESNLKLIIQKVFWMFADGAVLYGNYAKNVMKRKGFNTETFEVIHNSLNYERQLELRNYGLTSNIYRNHFQNSNHTIIFIGRLTKVKCLDMLVDALYNLRKKGHIYNLVFIGDGEERQNLEKRVEEYNLTHQVWFYGACYDEKLNSELIYNADLCVAPGNVGLTAMHTMVFGTPVITHNDFPWQMPEFEAIIPEKTGAFFKRNSVESLEESIQRWFDNHQHERDMIREACYNEIDSQWTPEYQLNILKSVIMKIN